MTKRLIASSIFVALLGSPAVGAAIEDTTCVVRIREATASDVLIRERNSLLGSPANANNAPGTGSLHAFVRNDSLHRYPAVWVVDTVTAVTRRLCSGSMPRLSPDGRWVACDRWLSQARPSMLAMVDVATGETSVLERVGQIEDYAWSPDSKRLAFTSSPYNSGWRFDVGWIDVVSESLHVLAMDPEPYVEYSGCEWAPDGRRFLVNRQRSYEHDDSLSFDLWLYDIDGHSCRLTHTPDRIENFPGWIDDRHIAYETERDEDTGGRPRYVIELGPARTRHRSR